MKKILVALILISYNIIQSQSIQSPSDFLGYELGTEFTRHHKVVDYYKYLANEVPDQVKIEFYGETNEKRPLFVTYISTSKNISNLENIRESHLKSIIGEGSSEEAIVWLSYNVHGNESVSTEASMKTIYELLTNQKALLDNTLIIIDPCLNPDGRDRYVNWYYQNKNATYNADQKSIEHNEPWLNGRPNHYMFDLNRDWAWLTQIESQQRIKVYNKWMPHIHVDFHEQGIEAPYYFAPAAEPYHEVITDFQRDFQVTIGKNHASYFDRNGWYYFTKEVFDLLYPSYGDTYPLYNGAIGMTYEQGGSGRAGLGVLTQKGDTLTLKDRIDHHFTTGISTIEVAAKNTEKLNAEFEKFYNNKEFKYKSYVLNGNINNLETLTKLLDQHEVKYGWTKPITVKGLDYASNKIKSHKYKTDALVVSTDQPKGTLVKVLFEPSAKLSDSLTYDITAWSLPYAYGLNTIASESKISNNLTSEKDEFDNVISENTYAYVTSWNSMNDARFLADLLQQNIKVRFSQKSFGIGGEKFKEGSLIITKSDNRHTKNFIQKLTNTTNKHTKYLQPTSTGFVDYGDDFGSSSVHTVKRNKIAILTGAPTRTLQFGEVWHFFEQQLNYPVTVLEADHINLYDLSKYDVLVLPNGRYNSFLNKEKATDLQKWVANGGKLIAMGGAIKALEGKKGFSISSKKGEKDATDTDKFTTYEESEREGIKKLITGAIFKTKVDNTNPLAYGYNQEYFTLKLGNDAYEYLETGNVVYLENNITPVSGFAGSEAQKMINETLVFGVERIGRGKVIYMVDNPIFRGFWENGKLFFANALFMVD
ncbi:zinc carboxypeptidase [Cellulophaga baltica]|uniref:M14 family metallopeptidase n=1 Tax=Cellulophaga TaxID=104264 RepID=UPI001C0793DF|nr:MULTISPECIES: M14 family metallopeptidase [Cellulophaga]MBU2996592.1 zinc carboxypeptidase [Cellulophaga baltica]MDO6767986.1 M14 family metallopeptidase [Cellulophaga sp. 1_MG-2023]